MAGAQCGQGRMREVSETGGRGEDHTAGAHWGLGWKREVSGIGGRGEDGGRHVHGHGGHWDMHGGVGASAISLAHWLMSNRAVVDCQSTASRSNNNEKF